MSAAFDPGDKVVWRHETRGGYGFIEHIPAIVVRDTGKRAAVRVALRDGTPVERFVSTSNLTERAYDFPPLDGDAQ